MSTTTQSELRLASLLDERETVTKLHETVVASVETNEDKLPTGSQSEQIKAYREKEIALDEEITALTEDVERNRKAVESSKAIRRVLAGNTGGIEVDGDKFAYRTMAAYARDVILSQDEARGAALVGKGEVDRARERLQLSKRAPEHTLSADVAGLTPDQHIAQIFQVIDASRPLVASALRVPLDRGRLTYPKITGKPTVADQGTEKTVANTPDLNVDMEEAVATTYNAGGNLSWQAINWSTPSALELWFRVAAADYALKTETDAGDVLEDSGFANIITNELDATPSYEEYVAAIADGAAEVYSASGRMADTIYFAPDEFFKFAALVPQASAAAFLSGGVSLTGQNGSFAGLQMVVSRGLSTGVALVGDSQGLLVAESPGAPVELRAVEAQIGGLEVGIIGAFEAVVVDEGAFSLITAAS